MVGFKAWPSGSAGDTSLKEQYSTVNVAERQPSPSGEGKDDTYNHEISVSDGTELHRSLKARHVTMIAIGGALGTGLLIGTGPALAQAGPGSIFIAYSFVGILVYLVMCALGEMAAWLPLPSGFTGYATRFVAPELGFSLGYMYWCKYIIVTPNQLVACALVLQYWVSPDRVNPGVFIAIFMVIIICINAIGSVRFFGEFEFWLSSMKVVIICGIIILCLVIALGGGPTHDRTGFRYWDNPGAFRPYIASGSLGKFLGFWSSMVNAVFAFLGTELVGVTVGEAQNPRRVIPKAIKLTFFRIVFFYILSILFLGMCVPYNSSLLKEATTSKATATASPFVVAVRLANISVLPHIINACLLIFTFSASNSDLYIASRTLYGLAKEGKAPKVFAKTGKNGIPYPALALSSCFCCLAFMATTTNGSTVFKYFVNLVSMFGLLTWISILVSHIYFVRAREAQGIPNTALVYTAPLGKWGSIVTLGFCCLIALTKNFSVFTGNTFDYKTFITGYLGIPLYLILIFGHKLIMGSKEVKPHEADLFTGKDKIDREEQEFLAKQQADIANGKSPHKAYKLISWLF